MPKRRRRRRFFLIGSLAIAFLLAGWAIYRYHGPAPEREIFRGITYSCERLPDTSESGGQLYLIRADLNVPGVSLYTTPLNPQAKVRGFEYLLQHTSGFVSDNNLAAAVNGTLFNSDSNIIRLPGDSANSLETVISDHVPNHLDPNSYLLWWDDQNIGHFEHEKPPPTFAINHAKWAIAGQEPILFPGYNSFGKSLDHRTAIAANPEKKLVWLACFDKASYRYAATCLRDHGATVATMLDGGTSVAMVIGSAAKNVRSGTVVGNWRPVATHVGFRADPLP